MFYFIYPQLSLNKTFRHGAMNGTIEPNFPVQSSSRVPNVCQLNRTRLNSTAQEIEVGNNGQVIAQGLTEDAISVTSFARHEVGAHLLGDE